jgi:ParB family chromosome partitioning protein
MATKTATGTSKTNGKAPAKRKASAAIVINQATNIPLNNLVLSDANVRQIGADTGIDRFAESIARQSLLQSIMVRPVLDKSGKETGKYAVPGGGRRLRALQHLVKKKRLPANQPIPCIIKTDGMAEEDSLVENSERQQLHPLDEFRAFAAMKANGKGEEDIAAAFGVTAAVVRQRLRLASASPVLHQAYADDEISLDQLMAFCLTTDTKKQEQVWENLKAGPSYNRHVGDIKRMIAADAVHSNDRRVKFIGLDAYEAAGGPVLRNLFSQRDEGYIEDVPLLDKLVAEKLAAVRDNILDRGFKWCDAAVEIPHDQRMGLTRVAALDQPPPKDIQDKIDALQAEYDDINESDRDQYTDEQEARMDAIERELNDLENLPPAFAPEDLARSGAFVTLDHDGSISVQYGYVRADDAATEHPADQQTDSAPATSDEAAEEPNKPVPASLIQDLTAYRTVALRDSLAHDFTTAFVAVLHVLCLKRYYHYAPHSCLELTIHQGPTVAAPGLDDWPTARTIDERNAAWRKKLPKNPSDLWQALLDMEPSDRNMLFAHCVGLAVNAVQPPHQRLESQQRHANQLANTLGMHMTAAGWTTTADNYFNRITKGHILDAVREAKGEDSAQLIDHLKKAEMAKEAERLVQGTGWLPQALRSVDAEQLDAPTPYTCLDDLDDDEVAEPTDLPEFLTEDDGEGASA